jgi:hypothetical protein
VERLNKIPGVELPGSKMELRPSFPLSVLAGLSHIAGAGRNRRPPVCIAGFSGNPQPCAAAGDSAESILLEPGAHRRAL